VNPNGDARGRAIFWAWHDHGDPNAGESGPRGFAMIEGESVTLREGGPSEEGYEYVETTYEHVGDGIRREEHFRSRDCDGLLERTTVSFCPLDRLAAHEIEGFRYPEWTVVTRDQRDHAAEAMGY